MPTANDHFRSAEYSLDVADTAELGSETERYHLARAQVHATLALAATNGANRTPVDRTITATGPAQGEEITDQMGDTPEVWYCGYQKLGNEDLGPCVFPGTHSDAEPHVDAEGREFRG